MIDQRVVWVSIVLSGVGTYAFRASFLTVAHRLVGASPRLRRVLRQIPPAVLAALVFPAFLRPEGTLDLWQPRLAAGLVAAVVIWRTRSVAATLLVGLGALVAIEHFA